MLKVQERAKGILYKHIDFFEIQDFFKTSDILDPGAGGRAVPGRSWDTTLSSHSLSHSPHRDTTLTNREFLPVYQGAKAR